MSFRDNLLHLRAVNNMTQEQLAMLLGVSRQSVTKWEAEKSYPEMDKLLKMCQIFDCTLDELVQGDLTGREKTAASVSGQGGTPADLFGYDEHMRKFGKRIAIGCAAPIAVDALGVLFFALGYSDGEGLNVLPDNISIALGLLSIFIGVACCLGCIIPAGMEHSSFVKSHPFIEDFYTEDEKVRARKQFTYELIGGIFFIFIGICCVIIFGDGPYELVGGVPLLLTLVSIGVFLILSGAMAVSRVDIDDYNKDCIEGLSEDEIRDSDLPEDRKEELTKRRRRAERSNALCGVIMIIATIAAFVMLFVPEYFTPLFWLAWPIGGLCCGIVSLLFRGLGRD